MNGQENKGLGKVLAEAALDPDALIKLSRARKDPDWLGLWRRQALESFLGASVPQRAEHLWRYTDPSLLEPDPELALRGLEITAADAPSGVIGGPRGGEFPLPDESAAIASFLNGSLQSTSISPELSQAGVILTDLRTAARDHPDRLRRVLGAIVAPNFGRLEALNGALFSGGAFLYVPRGVEITKPIHLVGRCGGHTGLDGRTGLDGGAGSDRPHTFARLAVLIEEGGSLTLIDELTGDPDDHGYLSYVAELELGPHSRLRHATIQTLGSGATLHHTSRARLDRGTSYTPILASFGGSLTKVDAGAILDGEGSESEMTGFVSAVGRQRHDHHTLHHHRGRHTHSNLDFKTVLKDRSRSAYTGLIRIEKEASYSQAYQENRNLLLSEHCRAESIPELEILTEEVQCKHGATVGPIDPDHLFYLMSRAIPEREAVRIIVEGHFESALSKLPTGIQDRLRALLRERLSA